jgi:hypothetical protein
MAADSKPSDAPAPSEPEQVSPRSTLKAAIAGVALALLGTVLVLGGFVLYLGNTKGVFLTFPFAGFITSLVGACLLAIGLTIAGTRVTVVFGSLIVATGIGLYLAGWAGREQYSGLFMLAGALVGVVGGGIIYAALALRHDK